MMLGSCLLDRVYKGIYPSEMVLNKTNTLDDKATFLDLDITIVNNKFTTTVYDKRNDFGLKLFLCLTMVAMSLKAPFLE